jgi:hypothetical protein
VGYSNVQVLPVKVLDADGLGQDSDIIAGILWAVDHNASVILMAFSKPGFSANLQDAIDYAWSRGVVLVAAAGNDASNTATFPAGDQSVIGVSATDQNDVLASTSNFGPSIFMAAPGVDIVSTYKNGGYVAWSGSSASAAFVAGLRGAHARRGSIADERRGRRKTCEECRSCRNAGRDRERKTAVGSRARGFLDGRSTAGGAPPVGDGGPFVGPYRIAARGISFTYLGTAGSSVTISASTGAITYATTGTNNCNSVASGGGTATVTLTGSCTTLSSSANGATLTLTAFPNASSYFAGWTAGDITACTSSPTTNPCSSVLSGNSNITATFAAPTVLTPTYTASNKVYDASTAATVSFVSFSPAPAGGDSVGITYSSASFANKNVGTGKTVTISGLSLTGAQAYKYKLNSTSAAATANITEKHITGTFTASNKAYDGSTSASVLTRSLTGVIAGDTVSLTGELPHSVTPTLVMEKRLL